MTTIKLKANFTNKLHADVAFSNLKEAGFKVKEQILENKTIVFVQTTNKTCAAAKEILNDSQADKIIINEK